MMNFDSKLFLADDNSLRLVGEMNNIFTNAFNLNNTVNLTQMTIENTVN